MFAVFGGNGDSFKSVLFGGAETKQENNEVLSFRC